MGYWYLYHDAWADKRYLTVSIPAMSCTMKPLAIPFRLTRHFRLVYARVKVQKKTLSKLLHFFSSISASLLG